MGPLPQPSYMRDVTVERHGGPLPHYQRPFLTREYLDIDQLIFDRELPQAAGVLHHCCSYKQGGRNLVILTAAPRSIQSGPHGLASTTTFQDLGSTCTLWGWSCW